MKTRAEASSVVAKPAVVRQLAPRHAVIEQAAISKMARRVGMSFASMAFVRTFSPLQNAERAIGKIETLGQYRDDIAKESLAELRIIGLHSFVRGRRQLIEHACGLGFDGGTAD